MEGLGWPAGCIKCLLYRRHAASDLPFLTETGVVAPTPNKAHGSKKRKEKKRGDAFDFSHLAAIRQWATATPHGGRPRSVQTNQNGKREGAEKGVAIGEPGAT